MSPVDIGFGDCVVCGGRATVNYPLLSGSPSFCGDHHNPNDAGRFGCDFSGPDDFDTPDEDEFDMPFDWPHRELPVSARPITTGNFVWTDIKGGKHKLKDIDDNYLANIIGFLKRRINNAGDLEMYDIVIPHWRRIITFLEEESRRRLMEVPKGGKTNVSGDSKAIRKHGGIWRRFWRH